ncbi:Uncharacterised protein [[Clostridium] sordellii]|uniref:Lipoprotein n=1 Tax=Paraclostridium sordellii TaxID=1505 RepID=A0ABP1XYF8_PARSO|nr:hypothetical protein [Paeniclostridium sordellii]EPZ56392.1 hypothetical protein H477_2638 [[Clostridium] sordellii ATCC 9714] [Paeniclostridium sordellii ATCC 9714]CEJ74429.1 hypothetical protein ATCC9714_23171 [[Clostridium] sordellii] [Paeniclostridium sordellii]CEN69969.1 Uncharacterised protein [[Clostridium] sordellii] [Paeniclostridium sordellii]CEN73292.1 Uncharacterised protein [[Clostridium] sordellii] [Paeniclostridium sordellii]CEO29488.1 Uncharacterised protein [[Clostridium] s
MKNVLRIGFIIILILIFTTPNNIFKSKIYSNKIDSNDQVYKLLLSENKNFEGIRIINNNNDKNKLMKNEEAYILFKNKIGKYYNNVTIKEKNDDIIITYEEADICSSYENNIYNNRTNDMMLIRIKANDNMRSFELLNH